jgi:hypothetical protein
MAYKFFLLLLAASVFISCEDEKEIYRKEALLRWQGDYAADGCGFFLEIDNKNYKPDNEKTIGDEFKNFDITNVIVEFKYTENKVVYYCGFVGKQEEEGINIISIKRISIRKD